MVRPANWRRVLPPVEIEAAVFVNNLGKWYFRKL